MRGLHERRFGALAYERLQHGAWFAPMIREVVRTKRMPPWHADPHIGVFKDDKSLSIEQKQQTLVHWIEAGSPVPVQIRWPN